MLGLYLILVVHEALSEVNSGSGHVKEEEK